MVGNERADADGTRCALPVHVCGLRPSPSGGNQGDIHTGGHGGLGGTCARLVAALRDPHRQDRSERAHDHGGDGLTLRRSGPQEQRRPPGAHQRAPGRPQR